MPEEMPKIVPITKTKFKIGDDKIYEKLTKAKGELSPYQDLFAVRETKNLVIDGVTYENAVLDGMGNILDWGTVARPSTQKEAAPAVQATRAKRQTKAAKKPASKE